MATSQQEGGAKFDTPMRAEPVGRGQTMQDDDGWKRFGIVRGPGIPAPTGQFAVGCVDLMHKLEGDSDGLLVRLFYPTLPLRELGGDYRYAKWIPNKRYLKANFVVRRSWFPGLMTFVTSLVLGIATSNLS